ncbi:MAG: TIM barrel protein [Anaerolineales bacterium]|nr:TIM barrel protein [Anaerolineales bacterium]
MLREEPASLVFGTVGSPASTPKKPGGSMGAALHLADLGLTAYELAWVQSVRVTEATCAQIRQAAAGVGVRLSIHAPYYINLNADAQEWPKSRKRLMDAAHYGNLAGATDIVFHPGSYFGRDPSEVLPVAIKRLRSCVEELRAAGNPVTLRSETMGKAAMLGSLADVLILSREIPGVLPCLDFSHLHARAGDGSMNTRREWELALGAYAEALGPDSLKQLHCHLSGIEYGPKGERNHLMLADSDFRLEELLAALHAGGCAGRILCESPMMDLDALAIQKAYAGLTVA